MDLSLRHEEYLIADYADFTDFKKKKYLTQGTLKEQETQKR